MDLSLGDDEALSANEADQPLVKKKKIDFFLDRQVDGNFHIAQAMNSAFKRHKDHTEWSG